MYKSVKAQTHEIVSEVIRAMSPFQAVVEKRNFLNLNRGGDVGSQGNLWEPRMHSAVGEGVVGGWSLKEGE